MSGQATTTDDEEDGDDEEESEEAAAARTTLVGNGAARINRSNESILTLSSAHFPGAAAVHQ